MKKIFIFGILIGIIILIASALAIVNDGQSIHIDLVSPANQTSTSNNNLTFQANLTSNDTTLNMFNLTLTIWNSTGDIYYNNTKNINFDNDSDKIRDQYDNCWNATVWSDGINPDQANMDSDVDGDVCDPCPADASNGCDTSYTNSSNYDPTSGYVIINKNKNIFVNITANSWSNNISIAFTQYNGTFNNLSIANFKVCNLKSLTNRQCFSIALNNASSPLLYNADPPRNTTFLNNFYEFKMNNSGCTVKAACDIFRYNGTDMVALRANCNNAFGYCILSSTYSNAINRF